MSSQPLERLPTIRAKLGSTIVVAVGVTIVLSYFLIGFALRNSPRDTEAVVALKTARRAATGRLEPIPEGVMVVRRSAEGAVTIEGSNLEVLPPTFDDGAPHWGVLGANVYASIPDPSGGTITVVERSPSRGFLGRISATLGFLQSMWWQLLSAGLVSAAIALLMARWLARGMTQPLRDMAQAARRMETGDYSTRVHTRSRDEVGQLADAFNTMSAELEGVERLRRELIANVSHELKTPIAAIRAHLENVLDGVERPDPDTLQVMLTQSERLGRLVDQLLDLSRLESGDVPLDRSIVPLGPLVSQVLSEIDVARPGRGVAVTSQVADDTPAAFADRERVHQVLFNLVDNAVRFTPDGGAVTVSAHRHDGNIEIEVHDSGVGIVAEHLPRLFERFYRVDTSRSRADDGGTGIGLAIARSVVEAHGGHIRADSEPGRGSTFTFELPVATSAEGKGRDG
jgi:signal transduction histidine kinase